MKVIFGQMLSFIKKLLDFLIKYQTDRADFSKHLKAA